MIIWVRFVETMENRNVIPTWCLFMVPDIITINSREFIQANNQVVGNFTSNSMKARGGGGGWGVGGMCLTVCSKSAPSNDSEMMLSSLAIIHTIV